MYLLKLLFCICSLLISNLLLSQDCSFNIAYEQQSCTEYDLFTTEQELVDWYVNDVFQLTATEYDFNATTSGTYVICAVNEGCPEETTICETFVITEDCFESECPISISYEEHACNTFTFTEDYGTQVAWTINGEFNNYFHGMDFDPTEPGTYEICATYETEDCPLGVTACETLVISEDCFEDECEFNVEINQQSCAEYNLFTTEQELVDWYVNDEFQLTGTGYDFYPTTAGTYEICVVNEGCPSETTICETLVITEDCLTSITIVNNYEISNMFNVYPNPAIDFVSIAGNLEKVNSIKIHDATGNLVYLSIDPSSKNIPVANLSNGLYFVSFSTNEGVGLRKLLINK